MVEPATFSRRGERGGGHDRGHRHVHRPRRRAGSHLRDHGREHRRRLRHRRGQRRDHGGAAARLRDDALLQPDRRGHRRRHAVALGHGDDHRERHERERGAVDHAPRRASRSSGTSRESWPGSRSPIRTRATSSSRSPSTTARIDVDETASTATVTGDGTATVVITGTVAEINAILSDANGVTYLNDAGFLGHDRHAAARPRRPRHACAHDSATVTIQFNQPPVAADLTPTTNEDTPVAITLSATDADDDDLTFAIVDGPDDGTLGAIGAVDCTTVANTCTAPGDLHAERRLQRQPTSSPTRPTTATTPTPRTVDITVDPVNDAPVAVDDSFATDEDTPLIVARPRCPGQRHRHRRRDDPDRRPRDGPDPRRVVHPQRRRLLRLHPGRRLQRPGLVHLQGQRRHRRQQHGHGQPHRQRRHRRPGRRHQRRQRLLHRRRRPGPGRPRRLGHRRRRRQPRLRPRAADRRVASPDRTSWPSHRPRPGSPWRPTCPPPARSTSPDRRRSPRSRRRCGRSPTPTPATTPSTADRTATFTVDDGALTGSDTRDITVAAVNDAPVITLSGSTPTFTEDGAAVTVDGGLTVTDPDDTNLESGIGDDHRRPPDRRRPHVHRRRHRDHRHQRRPRDPRPDRDGHHRRLADGPAVGPVRHHQPEPDHLPHRPRSPSTTAPPPAPPPTRPSPSCPSTTPRC